MSEAIERKIREAKKKYANRENFYNHEQGDENLFDWLQECLERAKKRKYNDILVHLATIGKAMEENPDKTIGLTMHHKEVDIAIFLARSFEDLSAIWYLEDLTMETLRKTKSREFNRIIQNMKKDEHPIIVKTPPTLKRQREEELDEAPSKKQKFPEFEIDPDFEGWLTGEQEYLEGINA